MFTNLLTEAQGGIPSYVWIIVGIIAAIILFVISLKVFWISKPIAILFSALGLIAVIINMCGGNILGSFSEKIMDILGEFSEEGTDIDNFDILTTCIIGGFCFFMSFLYLIGNMLFDSNTEGDYLIFGTLVHDTNHPVSAFFGSAAAFLFAAVLIFIASYYWTLIIGLIALIFNLVLSVGMIIERIVKG